MSILTARSLREEFHKLGAVNTRSENLRGKFIFLETRVCMEITIVSIRVIYRAACPARITESVAECVKHFDRCSGGLEIQNINIPTTNESLDGFRYDRVPSARIRQLVSC